MAEALEAADLPTGVFNLIQGGRTTGAALLDQNIDALLFTGSGAAGAHFRKKFADDPHVILALELGGNNPLVVWDAADAQAVAGIVIQSAFITTGQRCSCARRLIVPEGAAGDAVIEAVRALADRLTFAPWTSDGEVYGGPLISARAADGALKAVDALITGGARVIRPFGRIPGLSDAFVAPGILDMAEARDIPDEEIFAPVLQVYRAADSTPPWPAPTTPDTACPPVWSATIRPTGTASSAASARAWSTSTGPPRARRATCPSAAWAPAATTAPAPTTPPTTAPTPWPVSRRTRSRTSRLKSRD